MVRLHIKRGDESQFLYETTVETQTDAVIEEVREIYNFRLKIERVCSEMEELSKHGTFLPPDMIGLTDEQIEELKLVDTFGETCTPSGGFSNCPDPIGRRNGKAPDSKMQNVLMRTLTEVKSEISNKLVERNVCLTLKVLKEQLEILRGACIIVYPMNLPPHDPIRLEFEGKEDLSGTQAALQVIENQSAELWFCGKQIYPGKLLKDFIGGNEKTKVIVKIQKKGQGVPGREPPLSEQDQKALMMFAYKKREELKESKFS